MPLIDLEGDEKLKQRVTFSPPKKDMKNFSVGDKVDVTIKGTVGMMVADDLVDGEIGVMVDSFEISPARKKTQMEQFDEDLEKADREDD